MIRIIILCILLTACFHHEKSSDDSNECETIDLNIQGCWKSTECIQATNENDEKLGIWLKSEYEFTSSGQLTIKGYEFSDSSCTGSFKLLPSATNSPTIKYDILGKITSESGLEGDQVEISLITDVDPPIVSGVIVITDNDELCSSNAFYFGSEKFIISEAGLAKSHDMFENCLIRGKLP